MISEGHHIGDTSREHEFEFARSVDRAKVPTRVVWPSQFTRLKGHCFR